MLGENTQLAPLHGNEAAERIQNAEIIGAKSPDIREALLQAGRACGFDLEKLPEEIPLDSENTRVFAAKIGFPKLTEFPGQQQETLAEAYETMLHTARQTLFEDGDTPTEQDILDALRDDFVSRFRTRGVNVCAATGTRVTGHYRSINPTQEHQTAKTMDVFRQVLSTFNDTYSIEDDLAAQLYKVALAPTRDPNAHLKKVGNTCYETVYGNEAIAIVNDAVETNQKEERPCYL